MQMSKYTEGYVSEQTLRTLLLEIKGLRNELNELRTGIESAKIKLDPNYLYTNKDVRLILGVDERLIKKYRDNGFLTYHRQNDKYWYRGVDILDFLKRSRYQAFA